MHCQDRKQVGGGGALLILFSSNIGLLVAVLFFVVSMVSNCSDIELP